jgi:hypothetical protein
MDDSGTWRLTWKAIVATARQLGRDVVVYAKCGQERRWLTGVSGLDPPSRKISVGSHVIEATFLFM